MILVSFHFKNNIFHQIKLNHNYEIELFFNTYHMSITIMQE